MTTVAEGLAGVLAAHRIVHDHFSPLCACGRWRDKRDDGTRHRAHVAAAVLAHIEAVLDGAVMREMVARRIADREVGKRGAMPFADTSWAHVDKREWTIAAADVLAAVKSALGDRP